MATAPAVEIAAETFQVGALQTVTVNGVEVQVHLAANGWAVKPCARCWEENGRLEHFAHVFNGVCFKCNGHGAWRVQAATAAESIAIEAKRLAANARARVRAQAKRQAQQEAEAAAFAAVEVAFAAELAALVEAHPLLADATYVDNMLAAGVRGWAVKGLGKAAAAIEHHRLPAAELVAEAEAAVTAWVEQANGAAEVPAGRQVVTGEVVGVKWVDGYGYNAVDVMKLVVADDRGFKVYGTAPRAIAQDVERGARVQFAATLERSADDAAFGFYARPASAVLLAPAPAES